jgi:uncharacterized protein (TIGR02186 family)
MRRYGHFLPRSLHRTTRCGTFWRGCTAALLLIAAFLLVAPVQAQNLSSGLSTDVIQITSNFTGTEIVLFGALEDTSRLSPLEERDVTSDVIVVIRGPDTDITVRRKERIAGLWINRKQVTLTGLPGYYFLASTRPLSQIAAPAILDRFGLGTSHLAAHATGATDESSAFLTAAVRTYTRDGLYRETGTIEFLGRTLFRARIPVPATVPDGPYKAEVYLFQNGGVVSAQSSPLYVDKSGFERRVYNYAYRDGALYGLATVAMALLLGWLSFAIVRQRG